VPSRSLGLAILLLTLPASSQAQGTATVRVVRAAAVLEQPQGSATALGSVNPGEVLEVLDERDGWFLVRPPAGSATSWRTGWVNGASVEPMRAGTAPRPAAQAAASSTSFSAARKGFIIGLGGGGGLHRAPISPGFVGGPTASAFAIMTDFRIGYAPTDQVLIYYNNTVAWSRSSTYDIVGLSGVGVTYMIKPTSPSSFVTGAFGAGSAAEVDFGSGSFSDSETGSAVAIGGGYEFARHWSIEGAAIFVRLGTGNNHTVLKASFNWMFY
jgi:hypothetical protein